MHKHPLRRMGAAILSLALAAALVTVPAAATTGSQTIQAVYSDIKVMLDGQFLVLTDADGNTVEPFAVDGTTYLPIRAIAGALGLGVEWNAETSTVALTSGGEVTTKTTTTPVKGRTITIGTTANYADIKVTLDGAPLNLTNAGGGTVEPFAVNGTTYLPIRAISNALGLEVGWDGEQHIVTLTTEPFTITGDEAQTYVQGFLDEVYLGKYNPEYLQMIGITEDEALTTHLHNVEMESEFFCKYWGIVRPDLDETYEALDADVRSQIMSLIEDIYTHSKFTVSNPQALANGDYTVDVKVSPINVMQLADEAYNNDTYAPLANFFAKYTREVLATMTDQQYAAYSKEYALTIVGLVRAQMDSLDYLAEETVTFRVEKTTNATFRANNDDFNAVDALIIYYPSGE